MPELQTLAVPRNLSGFYAGAPEACPASKVRTEEGGSAMYCVLRSEIGGKPGNRVIFSGEDRRDAVRFLDRTVKEAPGFIYKIVEIPNKAEIRMKEGGR